MRRLLPLLLLCACRDQAEPGDLRVAWLTNQGSCRADAVARVAAEVFDFDRPKPVAAVEVACDAGEATVGGVRPGEYTLRLRGIDAAGCWTHEARRDDVEIEAGGVTTLGELPLLRRVRPLRVEWAFAGEEGCRANGVHQVEVVVEVEGGFRRSWLFMCDDGRRELSEVPRGDAQVHVVGFDAGGTPIADGRRSLQRAMRAENPCASFVEVPVALSPCREAGCE